MTSSLSRGLRMVSSVTDLHLKRRFLVPWHLINPQSSQQVYIISYNLIDIDDDSRLLVSSLCISDVSIAYGEIIYGTNMGHDDVTLKLEVMMT
jgi:hypothetical protein